MSDFPGGDYDNWKADEPDPFERDDGYDDEREEPPTFGCACENPLVVDFTCRACCYEMQLQHVEALRADLKAAEEQLRALSEPGETE